MGTFGAGAIGDGDLDDSQAVIEHLNGHLSLDLETGREIVELLSDLHRKGDMTIIVATHDEAISTAGVRVLRLCEGRFFDPEGGGE